MKIDVQWGNEPHTIVHYTFYQGWGWADIDQALKQAAEMMSSVDHTVDVIMDFSGVNALPQGAVTQIKRAFSNPKPSNLDVTVMVGANMFIEVLVSTGRKLSGKVADNWPMEFVSSVDEAYALIEKKQQVQK